MLGSAQVGLGAIEALLAYLGIERAGPKGPSWCPALDCGRFAMRQFPLQKPIPGVTVPRINTIILLPGL